MASARQARSVLTAASNRRTAPCQRSTVQPSLADSCSALAIEKWGSSRVWRPNQKSLAKAPRSFLLPSTAAASPQASSSPPLAPRATEVATSEK